MTEAQARVVEECRASFERAGWRVIIAEEGDTVVVSVYGGPRAVRMFYIAPDGTVTIGAMA